MINKFALLLLMVIVILAALLRLYRLDSNPPSISWDEAAVGVNAWTIANFGKDEYGKSFPISFRSFGEYKHPVLIYTTALAIKFLGLNEFSTRLPLAVFGVLNVILIFFLGKILFKNILIALSAALFLATSPYNIHFSRFNHEANLALFLFMLAIILFYLSFKRNFFLPLSVISFAICFITYLPAKLIVPITFITLVISYIEMVTKNKKGLLISSLVVIFFLFFIISNPQLLGTARANQALLEKGVIEKTQVFKLTHSELLGRINQIIYQYSLHFSPQYLFTQGDKNPRLSSQTGEFYKLDAVFLILGAFYIMRRRSKESSILLTWALIAPLPSSLAADAPHAGRAMFMMGSYPLISALGFYFLISFLKKLLVKWVIVAIILIAFMVSLISYLTFYYKEYPKRYAIEWQYGMKQVVEFVKMHPEYTEIYMTDIRFQPYIFFLYYLKMPLNEYLNTVVYNNLDTRNSNNVSYFGRYFFGVWDPIESIPKKEALYVISPSQYDGLRYKSSFDIKRLVNFPNDTAAFFIIGSK